jgi:hypothetical protein
MRIVLTLLMLLFWPLVLAFYAARTAGRRLAARGPRALPAGSSSPTADDTADLAAYPERLAELEVALAGRHTEAQQQRALLEARRAEVANKPGREELARKYEADEALLVRRAAGMRHVLGVVYRTRAVLLLRVHLAVTARRRPALDDLPRPAVPMGARGPGSANPVGAKGADLDLAAAAERYHSAADAVRAYVTTIEARAGEVADLVPAPDPVAEVDDAQRASIAAERDAVAAAYAALRDRMDHLADNLTFLGDHHATRRVVDGGAPPAGGIGAPARLFDEIAAALAGLDDLAGRVDPAVVDSAVDQLADEIGRLEASGLEAQADTDAHLEVERLLGRMTPT